MDSVDYNAKRKSARWVWFFIIGAVWMIFMIAQGNAAYDKAAAETATKTGFAHFWSSGAGILNSDADNARMGWIMGGVFGLVGVFIVAHFISGAQINLQRSIAEDSRNRQLHRERREFEEKLDRETDRLTSQNKLAQSKRELVRQLGVIDGFIRALSVEPDVSKRTTALQGAHEIMTGLAARLASGDILREALEDRSIQEQACETVKDLDQADLSNDRLTRDLIRLFSLKRG